MSTLGHPALSQPQQPIVLPIYLFAETSGWGGVPADGRTFPGQAAFAAGVMTTLNSAIARRALLCVGNKPSWM